MIEIHGTTDAKFAKLRDAFASCFAELDEHGASVAVVLEGKPIANLWAGHADIRRTRPWQENTLTNVWSCAKGVVAAAVAIGIERDLLRYDEPIAKVWPEFAAHGKEAIPLDLVMSHRAGLNGLNHDAPENIILDWKAYTHALANMAPNYDPGSACVYHALSYGHLAYEPLRRVTGTSAGQFISRDIASPLGAEFYIGVPASEDSRCAEMVLGLGANDWITQILASRYPQSCSNPTPDGNAPNMRAWRAAEIPGGNGHCTALGLAKIYGDLASARSKLLKRSTLTEALRLRFRGLDEGAQSEIAWAAGFRLEDPSAYGTQASIGTFGHAGWGGSVAFGDPEVQLGFAFVTNHMLAYSDGIDPRRRRLTNAVYDAISI